jgi:hypothetical protein
LPKHACLEQGQLSEEPSKGGLTRSKEPKCVVSDFFSSDKNKDFQAKEAMA